MNTTQQKLKTQQHWIYLRELGYTGASHAKINAIERRASKLNEDYCNVPMSEAAYTKRRNAIIKQVKSVFGGDLPEHFHLNGDPRGYALKLDAPREFKELMHRDFGGYIILAPDAFDGSN